MVVTKVRVRPVPKGRAIGAFRGYCDVELDHCLLIHNVKVVEAHGKLFVAMPSQLRNGKHEDTVHPTNPEFRAHLQDAVLAEYERLVGCRD